MSFKDHLEKTPMELLHENSLDATNENVMAALQRKQRTLHDLAALLSPTASKYIESIARASQHLTQQRFGKIIQLYAPLYLSSECANTCLYCGFSRENDIVRRTLSMTELESELSFLLEEGIKHILLVTGEHPHAVSPDFIKEVISRLHHKVSSLSLEVAPQSEPVYADWVKAGAEGLVIYQETYQKEDYKKVHLAGKKKDYDWRLETPERAARGGMKKIGIGILLGLANWRKDALAVAAHVQYLQKYYWRSQFQISLPRLRPTVGNFKAPYTISDKEFVQLICALRLTLPDTGLVLSTRERPRLRNALIDIGITQMSAGSKTEPGGYLSPHKAEEQFAIEDLRCVNEVKRSIQEKGYEAVFKDWEKVLND